MKKVFRIVNSVLAHLFSVKISRCGQKRKDHGAPRDLRGLSEREIGILDKCMPYTMTSEARILSLVDAVDYVCREGIPGSFVECGVWKGGSSMAMLLSLLSQTKQDHSREMYLYDTFEGMPAPDDLIDIDYGGKRASEQMGRETVKGYAALAEVQGNLSSTNYPSDRIHYVKGKVEETLPQTVPEQIAILRLDTDWYSSTKEEMERLFPRLMKGGVLIIDDYGHWQGARKAIDEYVAKQGLHLFLHRVDYTGRLAIKQ